MYRTSDPYRKNEMVERYFKELTEKTVLLRYYSEMNKR